MRNIYSKIKPEILLHIVNKKEEIIQKRQDICPIEEYLQVASMKLLGGQTFPPHAHIKQIRTTDIAQESWIILEGKVEATLYDTDDSILEKVILEPGDCSITFRGGHTYKALEDSFVYEYKTGPYQGQKKDKRFII